MKKLVMLVLALVLCLSAVSAMATNVSDFSAFKNAVEDSSTTEITLMADITDGQGVVFNASKNLTIDFNGHTYTFASNAVGSTGTTTLGFQLLNMNNNITMKNGTLTSTAGSGIKRLIQNYTNLKLINMTLDGSNLDAHSDNSPNIVVSFNNASSSVEGNTSIIAATGDTAFDAWDYYKNGTQVTVNTTGNIIGNIGVGGEDGSTKTAELTIKNLGKNSQIKKVIVSKGNATMNNLPVGTEIENDGNGKVVANGVDVGDFAYVIPAPAAVNWDAPETGDKENMMMWVALLAMSAIGLGYSRKLRRN